MIGLVLDGPRRAAIRTLDDPVPGAGEVVVRVHRVGICGTDRELFDGSFAKRWGADEIYPRVPGHEWTGTIAAVGPDVAAALVGTRVVGDTFIGCGACRACAAGRTSVCPRHREVGVRGADGALAEWMRVPLGNAVPIPDDLGDAAAALVEPLSNAVRAVIEAGLGVERILIRGAGTLGLLAARYAASRGIHAVLRDPGPAARDRAERLGFDVSRDQPTRSFDAVLDLAPVDDMSGALDAVADGGTIVVTGLPGPGAMLATRELVERDLRVIGTLGAPRQLAAAVEAARTLPLADLVTAAHPLDAALAFLRGDGPPPAQPKLQIDPRLPLAHAARTA